MGVTSKSWIAVFSGQEQFMIKTGHKHANTRAQEKTILSKCQEWLIPPHTAIEYQVAVNVASKPPFSKISICLRKLKAFGARLVLLDASVMPGTRIGWEQQHHWKLAGTVDCFRYWLLSCLGWTKQHLGWSHSVQLWYKPPPQSSARQKNSLRMDKEFIPIFKQHRWNDQITYWMEIATTNPSLEGVSELLQRDVQRANSFNANQGS